MELGQHSLRRGADDGHPVRWGEEKELEEVTEEQTGVKQASEQFSFYD